MQNTHRIDLTVSREMPFCRGARELLAAGADPTDRLEGWRGDMLCLVSTVGDAAALTVAETSSGPKFRVYRPFEGTGGE